MYDKAVVVGQSTATWQVHPLHSGWPLPICHPPSNGVFHLPSSSLLPTLYLSLHQSRPPPRLPPSPRPRSKHVPSRQFQHRPNHLPHAPPLGPRAASPAPHLRRTLLLVRRVAAHDAPAGSLNPLGLLLPAPRPLPFRPFTVLHLPTKP